MLEAVLADEGTPQLVDVENLIDEETVGAYQIRVTLLCAAVLFIDGFDAQAIGYVAPALARALNLPRSALGPVFGAGLVGLMIGALVFGPLADRVGRKRIIVVSVAAFGVAALATVLATDATTLIAMRFLTGLGLGGAMPNAIALTAEFSPRRRRATMVMLMICGLSIGAALGGLIAAALIPALGWRSVFFVGGIAPLVFVPFLARNLPESVRFLVHSGASPARLAEILGDAFPQRRFPRGFRFGVKEAKLAGFPVTHLFKEGRTAGTLLLWVVFFASLLDLYFLSNWLPTVLSDLGASDSLAATIGAMLQVGGVVGTLVLGRFIDRFSFRALSLTYFLASIAIAAIGFAAGSLTLAGLAVFCAGFCVIGGQIAANALAAEFYPTGARSAGIGWTLGIGRIGSIVGPLVGGVLLGLHWSTHALFLAAAAPAAFGAMAALALNLVLKQRIAPAAVRGAATP